jgi:hypothetical protein
MHRRNSRGGRRRFWRFAVGDTRTNQQENSEGDKNARFKTPNFPEGDKFPTRGQVILGCPCNDSLRAMGEAASGAYEFHVLTNGCHVDACTVNDEK